MPLWKRSSKTARPSRSSGSRQETVDKALAKLKAENPDWDVIGMAPDLTDYAAVDAAMAKVTEAFGRIDILVNNAGISAREPLYQYDPAAFKNIMDLNVTAVFNGCAPSRRS